MKTTLLSQIDAVCFDAFGTVVDITRPRRPFLPLFRALTPTKRQEFKKRLMREDCDLSAWPIVLEAQIDPWIIDKMVEDVGVEVQSVRLKLDMENVWQKIEAIGLKIAICSNLASPYGPPVLQSLPGSLAANIFSFEVGAIKPELEIYRTVLDRLGLLAGQVLFVGDNYRTDIAGPAKFGFQTMHISDFHNLK